MKVKAKSVVVPTVAKPAAPVKSGPERKAVLCAVGLRGVILSPGFLSSAGFRPVRNHNGEASDFSSRPVQLGEKFAASWKGSGAESLWGKACGLYVSPAGEPVRLFELSKALSLGIVRKVKGTVEGKAADLYVPATWSDKMELPSYIGAENPGGRVESFGHPDGAGRQAGFARACSIGAASYSPKGEGKAKPITVVKQTRNGIPGAQDTAKGKAATAKGIASNAKAKAAKAKGTPAKAKGKTPAPAPVKPAPVKPAAK